MAAQFAILGLDVTDLTWEVVARVVRGLLGREEGVISGECVLGPGLAG